MHTPGSRQGFSRGEEDPGTSQALETDSVEDCGRLVSTRSEVDGRTWNIHKLPATLLDRDVFGREKGGGRRRVRGR